MKNQHSTVAVSTELRMNGELLDTILESHKRLHLKETILLFRGKPNENLINVSEVVIPPLATYGKGFSALPAYMLQEDFPSLV